VEEKRSRSIGYNSRGPTLERVLKGGKHQKKEKKTRGEGRNSRSQIKNERDRGLKTQARGITWNGKKNAKKSAIDGGEV